jgi:hypothetical protein
VLKVGQRNTDAEDEEQLGFRVLSIVVSNLARPR